MNIKGKINIGSLKTEEEIVITPEIEEQIITPSNANKTFNKVTVTAVNKEIDENITEENIREGVSILGVTGTLKDKKIEGKRTVTPSTEKQTIIPSDGYDGLSDVDVEAVTADIDANIKPENIRENIEVLGITGTMHEDIKEEIIVKSTEEEQVILPSEGNNSISKVTVAPIVLEEKTQRANKNNDVVLEASEGYDGIKKITIPKIRLKSKTATPKTTEQTIKLNTFEVISNDGLSEVVISPVDASIDKNIIPENIKEGISILGVTGTHQGGEDDTLTALFNNTLTSYSVPYGTEEIKDNFFNGNTNLVEITLQDTISSYGQNAFKKTGITSLFIPKNKDDKKITFDSYAFGDMMNLKNATLAEGLLINSSSYMFYQSRIETAVVPCAENGMFLYCRNLKTITFNDPDNINKRTSIGSQAFRDCELLEAIDIPEFITSIGSYSFSGCKSLTSFEIKAINCSMNSNSFTGCTGITDFQVSSGHCKALYLSDMTALTHDSLVSLINNLGTVSNLALNIGATNKAKLTEEEIAIATNKGWVVS